MAHHVEEFGVSFLEALLDHEESTVVDSTVDVKFFRYMILGVVRDYSGFAILRSNPAPYKNSGGHLHPFGEGLPGFFHSCRTIRGICTSSHEVLID